MARYAQGKYALAVSDISGQSFPWNEMLTQWNGLFVHYSELETKQPQLNPYPHQADPTALGKVRVQQPAPDALRWLGYSPFQTFAAASGIIIVNQVDHQRTYGETVRFRGSPTTGGTSGTLDDGVFVFANIPDEDGITGANICLAAGYSIVPGKYTSVTTTLAAAITDTTTTTGITLTSSTNFPTTGPVVPTATNPVGTPTNAILVDTEIISYTGISSDVLSGVKRGANGSTAATHLISATTRSFKTPSDYYYFTVNTDTATTGGIKFGGYSVSSGPVTLKAIGPQS